MSNPDRPKLRLAIAGITHGHVKIIGRSTFSGMALVGVAEEQADLLAAFGREERLDPAILFTDLEAMLDAIRPEAVAAFGSIRDHLSVVEACAPRGIHVMVEKPLATSAEDAEHMAALAHKHGVHLLTNYETTWYASTHDAIARTADNATFGPIRKVVVHDGHRGPVEIGCSPQFLAWLTDPDAAGGGALPDFGCYGANIMTRIMGASPPLRVTAVTHQFKPELYPRVEDDATILVSYADAECIIQASWNWPVSRKDIEIYAQHGQYIAANARDIRTRMGDTAPELADTLPALTAPLDDPFAHFAAVIRGDIALEEYDLAGLANNVRVVQILDAARQSAATGQTVVL